MTIAEKIKAFLGIKPPKTDLADEIRKQSYEKERIRLAEIEGKRQAIVQSERFIKQLETTPQKENKPNWQNELKNISTALSDTFSSTFKPMPIENEDNSDYIDTKATKKSKKKKQKKAKKHKNPDSEPIYDGISPTFDLYKGNPVKKGEFDTFGGGIV